ncbi:unnamed protein product [Arctogadus glacialis]
MSSLLTFLHRYRDEDEQMKDDTPSFQTARRSDRCPLASLNRRDPPAGLALPRSRRTARRLVPLTDPHHSYRLTCLSVAPPSAMRPQGAGSDI